MWCSLFYGMINWSVGLRLLASLSKHPIKDCISNNISYYKLLQLEWFYYFHETLCFLFFLKCLHTLCLWRSNRCSCSLQLFCMSDEAKQAPTKKLKEGEQIFHFWLKQIVYKKVKLYCCCTLCGIKHDINRFLWLIIIVYGTCRSNRMHTNSSLGDIWDLSVTWLIKCAISCQKLSSVCHW